MDSSLHHVQSKCLGLSRCDFDPIDHFARCKQHWSRSTSCFSFLTLHKRWNKIQPTEHLQLNQKVKHTALRCFLYNWNKEAIYKLKQEVFLDVLFTSCKMHTWLHDVAALPS